MADFNFFATKVKIFFRNKYLMKKIIIVSIVALLCVAATAPQKKITIFLCGDSTMADKPLTKDNRERGWGMFFAPFFNGNVRIENHAVNGRSTKSFRDLGHWQKVYESIKPGDYVIIEFGHNDAKLDDTVRYANADTDFRANLTRYVEETRGKGGNPVIYTSISRRKFDSTGTLVNTHGRYLEVTREVAAQLQVPMVDLYDSTANWLRKLGPDGSFDKFMNLASGESLCAPKGKEDNTHLNINSAPIVSKMAAEGLIQAVPELAPYFTHHSSLITHHSAAYYAPNQSKIAFPGADGFGKYTTGGRGGKVIYVTNLNDKGPGSLREAVTTKGARTVLFKISGTIHLETNLEIKADSITIAGQSAPGSGICITGDPVKVNANNVIIRYMHFRLGDNNGVEDDAISATHRKNIIIDHCTMSWSTDECASFYDNESFTLQYCLIYESLTNSVHAKGAHGYGGIWGGMGASFHHNLLAHHSSRNPRFCGARYHEDTKETEWVDFRNNVIYNWGFNSSYAGENGQHNIVNNYYKPGPATAKKVNHRILEAWQSKDKRGFHDFGKFYVAGNVMESDTAVTRNNWNGGIDFQLAEEMLGIGMDFSIKSPNYPLLMENIRANKAFNVIAIPVETAQQAYENVLNKAGAQRDAIDERVIRDVRTGTATYGKNGLIDSPKDVEALPVLKSLKAPADSDGDGIPDAWEKSHRLNPGDATDGATFTLSSDYTNLEVYLNSLITE